MEGRNIITSEPVDREPPRIISMELKSNFVSQENGCENKLLLKTEQINKPSDDNSLIPSLTENTFPEKVIAPNNSNGKKVLTGTLEKRHDESECLRSVRKKSSKERSNVERRTPSRKERSKSNTFDRKRRSKFEPEDSQDEDDDIRDRATRKRRKTPTKKVMKLHNLTADLLFQVININIFIKAISTI